MPTIAGLRGTGDWSTDERPKNFREMILWLDPNGEAPLTALLSKISSQVTDDPEFNWWEEEQGHVELVCNGGTDNATTTIPVDSGALSLVQGDLIQVVPANGDPTNSEILVVAATPTVDTQFTSATRGAVGTAAAVIADDALLLKIGNAHAEGTRSPDVTSRNPTKLHNFCQIFKSPYELTGTAEQTRTRTGDPLQNDKKRKMFDHSRDMELAFLFGRRFETTGTNGKPLRYTGGLDSFLTENRTFFGGGTAFTEDNFIDAISPVFDRRGEGSGDERLAFCGNGALTELNKLARNSNSTRVNFDGVVKVYGMKLQRWIVPQGTIYLRTHPLFNIHSVYKYNMMLLNPRGITYRFMKGRDTKFQDNIQHNDEDTRKGQWMGECGLEVHHAKTMGVLGNMVIVP